MYLRLTPQSRRSYGGALPWGYVRSLLAEKWHITPWAVDEAPAMEVALALKLAAIESEEAPD
jgi:hypothetical protein